MRRLIPSFVFLLVTNFNPAFGQDSSSISTLEPITAPNVKRLEQLDHFGDPRPQDLIWSPDGYTLGIGTEVDIRLYDTRDLNKEPVIADTFGHRYRYDQTGQFVTNDWHLWDTRSGKQITTESFSEISPTGKWGLHVESGEGIETVVTVWDTHNLDEPVYELRTGLAIEPIYYGVRFSPDETSLALMLSNEWQVQFNPTGPIVVQLWSLETGTLLNTIDLENGGWIMFSDNSQWLITNGAVYEYFYSTLHQGDIEIWDMHTGGLVARWGDAHDVMALSPDRRWFVFIQNGDIKLWENGKGLQSLSGLDKGAYRFVFSPNSQYLAGINYAQSVIWDLSQPQPVITLNTGDVRVYDYYFSPNSQLVASRNEDNNFTLWRSSTGQQLADLGNLENGIGAVYSPDGSQMALGSTFSFEGMLSIWDIHDTDNISAIYRFGPEQPIRLNRDWSKGAYWDEPAGNVHILDIETGDEKVISVLSDFLGGILILDTAHEQGIFTRGAMRFGTEQTFDAVDLATGQRRFSFTTPYISGWKMSPTGKQIALTYYPEDRGQDSPLYVYDLTKRPVEATRIPTEAETWKVTYSPDGSLIALTNRETDMVELWYAESAQLAATWFVGESLAPDNQFTPDGKWLITTSYSGGLSVWNIENLLASARSSQTNEIEATPDVRIDLSAYGGGSGLIVSPHSDKIAVQIGSNENNGLAVIDLAAALNSGNDVTRPTQGSLPFAPNAQIGPSFFSPDGRLLFANNQDEPGIFILDANTGEQVRHIPDANTYLSGPQSTFSPDGRLFVLNLDTEIQWWEVSTLASAQGGPIYKQPLAQKWWGRIGFNAEGTRLFASEPDGISVWGIRSE